MLHSREVVFARNQPRSVSFLFGGGNRIMKRIRIIHKTEYSYHPSAAAFAARNGIFACGDKPAEIAARGHERKRRHGDAKTDRGNPGRNGPFERDRKISGLARLDGGDATDRTWLPTIQSSELVSLGAVHEPRRSNQIPPLARLNGYVSRNQQGCRGSCPCEMQSAESHAAFGANRRLFR